MKTKRKSTTTFISSSGDKYSKNISLFIVYLHILNTITQAYIFKGLRLLFWNQLYAARKITSSGREVKGGTKSLFEGTKRDTVSIYVKSNSYICLRRSDSCNRNQTFNIY